MNDYPWYSAVDGDSPLEQGDLIRDCPLIIPPRPPTEEDVDAQERPVQGPADPATEPAAEHVNHVPAMAELLRSEPEAPFFGVWGTSVSENPFDPWDYDADASGSGIPLYPPLVGEDGPDGMYVLERHRHLL